MQNHWLASEKVKIKKKILMGVAVKMFSGAQFCGCKSVGWQVKAKKMKAKTKILMGKAVKMFSGA